jgi:hypothetical protein
MQDALDVKVKDLKEIVDAEVGRCVLCLFGILLFLFVWGILSCSGFITVTSEPELAARTTRLLHPLLE